MVILNRASRPQKPPAHRQTKEKAPMPTKIAERTQKSHLNQNNQTTSAKKNEPTAHSQTARKFDIPSPLRYPKDYSVEARLSSVTGFAIPAVPGNPGQRDTPPKSPRPTAGQAVGALGLNPSHCHPDPKSRGARVERYRGVKPPSLFIRIPSLQNSLSVRCKS